jgi:hypothetical protein
MIAQVFQDFDERVREIDTFLSHLRTLERPAVAIEYATHRGVKKRNINPDWMKTLKAASFLLLYNLVESALRRGLGTVYESMRIDARTYEHLRDEIRNLWIDQRYHRVDRHSASLRKYQEVAAKLVADVANDLVVDLADDVLPVSGNLDADRVRKVCHLHGIPVSTHWRALGGSELVTVMKHRNSLAHGNISFRECGRQYTTQELEGIKKQVVIFMRSILRNIGRYVDTRQYNR